MRNLELIGEAATHIPAVVRQANSEMPWHAIIGTRNRLAHAYLIISDSIIWGIIQEAIPDLLPAGIEFSEKVLSYTDGMDQDAFVADGRTYDATLRNLDCETCWIQRRGNRVAI